jgi:hypothetical protein
MVDTAIYVLQRGPLNAGWLRQNDISNDSRPNIISVPLTISLKIANSSVDFQIAYPSGVDSRSKPIADSVGSANYN